MNKIEFNNSWIEFNNKYKNLLDPNERRVFCLIKKIWTSLSSFVDKTWRYSSIYLSIRVHFTSLCGELQNKHFGFFFLGSKECKTSRIQFLRFWQLFLSESLQSLFSWGQVLMKHREMFLFFLVVVFYTINISI